ncbi:MAG: EamA family transporter [Tissierellia bacterium]|nr:EamA family transporter [Tissierellia bacterium]
MSRQLKYDFLLLLIAVGWGFSFYFIDISLQYMGPITLNAFRFLIAFFALGLLSLKKLKNPSKLTLKYSILIGVIYFVVYASVTIGVMFTSLSNASFLPGLSVIFTPILAALIYKKRPEKKLILAVLMSTIGLALLTLTNGLDISSKYFLGDLFCIITAITYAFAIILTGSAVEKEDLNPYQLGVYQLGVTGILSLILAFIFERPAIPTVPVAWFTVLFLALFCTGLALIITPIALQYTTEERVAIILALEPVFAGFVAYFFAGEVLTKRAYFGAVLMILSMFIMEIDFSKLELKLLNKWRNC